MAAPRQDWPAFDYATGITKREFFAAASLIGLNANPHLDLSVEALAEQAFLEADAMLAEAVKEEEA